LRTAEAAGAAGLVISQKSADVFSPKALRSAMGASFRMPVCENATFEEVIALANEQKMVVVAADISGSISYTMLDWSKPSMIVFGSEAHGLSGDELRLVNTKISIPMENHVESLNLAVSAGIILFEAKRQNS
jgi:RNA methyltransferase, TrmH family